MDKRIKQAEKGIAVSNKAKELAELWLKITDKIIKTDKLK